MSELVTEVCKGGQKHSIKTKELLNKRALDKAIERSRKYLPEQGPIDVFVHHNTLHHFEDMEFEDAVEHVGSVVGAEPYMSHEKYVQAFLDGKIKKSDLIDTIEKSFESGCLPNALPSFVPIRPEKFFRKLIFIPDFKESAEAIEHCIYQRAYLTEFVSQVSPHSKELLRNQELETTGEHQESRLLPSDREVDKIILRGLWEWVKENISVKMEPIVCSEPKEYTRNDERVNERLTMFLNAYFDLGTSYWKLPNRNLGIWDCFLIFLKNGEKGLPRSIRWGHKEDIHTVSQKKNIDEIIFYILEKLNVQECDLDEFVQDEILKLPGWSGTVSLFEHKPTYLKDIESTASLKELLAVRLILIRGVQEVYGTKNDLLPSKESKIAKATANMRFQVFHLLQSLGLSACDMKGVGSTQLDSLIVILQKISGIERRRLLHQAYEKTYRNQVLDAILCNRNRNRNRQNEINKKPIFQAFFCIDDREESLRRHLEEIEPNCDTYGVAGFFGLDMCYQGLHDTHAESLCPGSVVPKVLILEEAVSTNKKTDKAKKQIKAAQTMLRIFYHSSRDYLVGALFTALAGIFSCIPMVFKIHFPRWSQKILNKLRSYFFPDISSKLKLVRMNNEKNKDGLFLGYSIEEMADRVYQVLHSAGIKEFADWVLMIGHGSSSLNNPHESAYNCGACSGKRGGPNARAFAQMANMQEVRSLLANMGLDIPIATYFVGGYHDTCADSVTFYDLKAMSVEMRDHFEKIESTITLVRASNSHERCRKFLEVGEVSTSQALRVVESRSQDMREARPEYNHCTNSLCIIGGRDLTRNLFLDRRAFLVSYDPTLDEDAFILGNLLTAVIPVCAGINLEYYFSTVDNEKYGCGSKLPHNITGLIGVMSGGLSDLRTGLSSQMVEIHEPFRLVTIIESTRESMDKVLLKFPAINQLVKNRWIQLGLINGKSEEPLWYDGLETVKHQKSESNVKEYSNSRSYYEGRVEHLSPVLITKRRGEHY